ncbi:hypothetical protein [Thermococcus sp. Bubb.Bath]|uniref:hypothetical protein n=1 Tax=Thermococcus sp. Bubb.Bath TaxID=1638242 RepID=UPI001F0D24A7|nr:hypothetical protein [Thermococcus sp. Bubb.Bath]
MTYIFEYLSRRPNSVSPVKVVDVVAVSVEGDEVVEVVEVLEGVFVSDVVVVVPIELVEVEVPVWLSSEVVVEVVVGCWLCVDV